MTKIGMNCRTKREQELQRQLDEALDRIAGLERQRPQVAVGERAPTPYEQFIAGGKTHRDWVKRERRIAHMQNHY